MCCVTSEKAVTNFVPACNTYLIPSSDVSTVPTPVLLWRSELEIPLNHKDPILLSASYISESYQPVELGFAKTFLSQFTLKALETCI